MFNKDLNARLYDLECQMGWRQQNIEHHKTAQRILEKKLQQLEEFLELEYHKPDCNPVYRSKHATVFSEDH